MTARLLKIVPKYSLEYCKADAVACLEELKREGFETVIVHGFKDGKIYTKTSARKSAMELLGALEAAKVEVWER